MAQPPAPRREREFFWMAWREWKEHPARDLPFVRAEDFPDEIRYLIQGRGEKRSGKQFVRGYVEWIKPVLFHRKLQIFGIVPGRFLRTFYIGRVIKSSREWAEMIVKEKEVRAFGTPFLPGE